MNLTNEISRFFSAPSASMPAAGYTTALVQHAAATGLWQQSDTQIFYTQLGTLLAYITKRYTMGESSSVAVETAQNLMHSALYNLGLVLKTIPTEKEALQLLTNTSLQKLWQQGCQLAAAKAKTSRRLWLAVKASSITTPNRPYTYTLQRGLSPFFTSYDSTFAAHEIPADIDYPASDQTYWQYEGAEFMCHYLQALLYENQFLNRFSSSAVHNTLLRVQPTYSSLPLNLFEPVLLCAMGCLLSGASFANLRPSKNNLLLLQSQTQPELVLRFQQAGTDLCSRLKIENAARQYIQVTIQRAVPQLLSAAQHNNLSLFFLVE